MTTNEPKVTVKSIQHPGEKSPVVVAQEYATGAYVTLFFILAVIIYQRMVTDQSLLITGLTGVFILIGLANIYGHILMRNTFVEAGFLEDQFYIKNVQDVTKKKPPLYFPLVYANARREGDRLLVHYYGRVITLKLDQWKDPEQLIRQFGRF